MKPANERREHVRTKVGVAACVRQREGKDDIVYAVNLSRGGLRFSSRHKYVVGAWLEVAVPYTESDSNIFLGCRVIWRRESNTDGITEYAVQYLRSY